MMASVCGPEEKSTSCAPNQAIDMWRKEVELSLIQLWNLLISINVFKKVSVSEHDVRLRVSYISSLVIIGRAINEDTGSWRDERYSRIQRMHDKLTPSSFIILR